MDRPQIKIELQDGTNTWVTINPISQLTGRGAINSAAEAFGWFLYNLAHDEGVIDAHLAPWQEKRLARLGG